MTSIRREITLFFTALMFYTRIPCPGWINYSPEYLNLATRYFPLIGWIVALVSWLTFVLGRYVFPAEISLLFAMIAAILVTGAFHEDGWADVCDGFGGGWTKEKILLIMKDSRVGTYGVTGLLFILLMKFYALVHLYAAWGVTILGLIFISAHSLSRLSAVFIIFTTHYAREDADSKSKPVAQALSWQNTGLASLWALVPMAVLAYIHPAFLLSLLPCLLITIYLRYYFLKWIGGYTGDCLGATQQVNEVVFYLTSLAICTFI